MTSDPATPMPLPSDRELKRQIAHIIVDCEAGSELSLAATIINMVRRASPDTEPTEDEVEAVARAIAAVYGDEVEIAEYDAARAAIAAYRRTRAAAGDK